MKLHRDYDISLGSKILNYTGSKKDFELFYLLEGVGTFTISGHAFDAKEGDIILVNHGIERSCSLRKSPLILSVRVSRQILIDLNHGAVPYFNLNTALNPNGSYNEIKKALSSLIFAFLYKNEESDAMVVSCLYRVLYILMDDFLSKGKDGSLLYGDEKCDHMVSYIYEHFREHISMEQLAEEMFSSKSTLSRTFKKNTGEYFADFLLKVRLDETVKALVNTTDGITRIAFDCGFSNVSTLNRIFKEKYGMSPSEYRNKYQALRDSEISDIKNELESVEKRVRSLNLISDEDSEGQVIKKDFDINKYSSLSHVWGKTINISSFYNLTNSNMQFHLDFITKNLGFEYVRTWNVFSEKLMITDGKENSGYNYDMVDSVFDFLIKNGLKPFIDFGKRPDTAISSVGKTVYYENEYIEFESKAAFESMVRDFFRHISKRFGKEEINTWYFDITEDPHHASGYPYPSEKRDYFELYSFIYKTAKKYAPRSKVGGASMMPEFHSLETSRDFLLSCIRDDCRPDFASLLVFPLVSETSEDYSRYTKLPNTNFAKEYIIKLKELLHELDMDDCDIIISEINCTVSNRNYLNDSCYRGIWMIRAMMEFGQLSGMICPWVGSDWISSHYDTRSICNGAIGLLTKDSIRKPVYYALEFLNQLGDELVAYEDGCIVTRKNDREYIILCFNEKELLPKYYLQDDYAKNPADLIGLFADKKDRELKLTLSGVDNTDYVMKLSRINNDRGSILAEWGRFGYESDLKRSDIKYIDAVSIPWQERHGIKVTDGRLDISLTLADQEMTLIQIFEEE